MRIQKVGISLLLGAFVGACGARTTEPKAPEGVSQSQTEPAQVAAQSAPTPAQSAESTAAAEKQAVPATDAKSICARVETRSVARGSIRPIGGGVSLPLALPGAPVKSDHASIASARGAKSAADQSYSLADLKALAAKSQWQELIGHIEDIPPKQRNAEWDALLERAAIGLISNNSQDVGSYASFSAAERLVERYQALGASKAFMAKRFEVAAAAYQSCLNETYDGGECVRSMEQFVKVGTPPSEVPFRFGKMIRAKLNHYVAVPFFHRALQGKPINSPECSDADLQLAVEAGLGLPSDEESARQAREIAGDSCWPSARAALLEQLTKRGEKSYDAQNICSVLKAKGEL
jgi:hypothetical protein